MHIPTPINVPESEDEAHLAWQHLTITDGFQFGCGFFLAGCLFVVVLIVLTVLIFGLMTVFNLGGILPRLPGLSSLLDLLPALAGLLFGSV